MLKRRLLPSSRRGRLSLFLAALLLVSAGSVAAFYLYRWVHTESAYHIGRWFTEPESRRVLGTSLDGPCPGAPFLLPSTGFIGLLYADPAGPYHILRRHTGIDIFGNGQPGEVPVVAAYDGYLTRLPDWKSTVIIRHDDPLQPGRVIWTYYTHMANISGERSFVLDSFPPGTSEVPVKQGQLIGYQGNYGGTLNVGLHLHFSIVQSEPDGSFKNEAVLANTLDPSPYLGMQLDTRSGRIPRPVRCGAQAQG